MANISEMNLANQDFWPQKKCYIFWSKWWQQLSWKNWSGEFWFLNDKLLIHYFMCHLSNMLKNRKNAEQSLNMAKEGTLIFRIHRLVKVYKTAWSFHSTSNSKHDKGWVSLHIVSLNKLNPSAHLRSTQFH